MKKDVIWFKQKTSCCPHVGAGTSRTRCCAGETGANTMWRVINGEAVTPSACPKLFQVYTVRKAVQKQTHFCNMHVSLADAHT